MYKLGDDVHQSIRRVDVEKKPANRRPHAPGYIVGMSTEITTLERLVALLEEAPPRRKTTPKVVCTLADKKRPRVGWKTMAHVRSLSHYEL